MVNVEQLDLAIKEFDVLKAEELIEEDLKNNQNDIELWLKLSVTELCVPIVDYTKSLDCIKRIYKIDKDNLYALIMECCIYQFHLGAINEQLYSRLNKIKNYNKEIGSIIKYIMSWYYGEGDIKSTISLLEQSIRLCDRYVSNYEKLGRIYLNQENIVNGNMELFCTSILPFTVGKVI